MRFVFALPYPIEGASRPITQNLWKTFVSLLIFGYYLKEVSEEDPTGLREGDPSTSFSTCSRECGTLHRQGGKGVFL